MKIEALTQRERVKALVAFSIGFFLEFLLIPSPHPHGPLLRSGNFYYALMTPFAVWLWFSRIFPAKVSGKKELYLALFIFGVYEQSAVQSIIATLNQVLVPVLKRG